MSEFNGKVFIPSNIKNNKQVIFWKLDARNIGYMFVGLIIFAIFFLLFKLINHTKIGTMLGLIFSTPFFIVSFIKIKGLNIEDFITIFKANKFSSGSVRINNTDNLYEILEKNNYLLKEINKNNSNKKNFFLFSSNKTDKSKKMIIDTDDNLIKIQNIEDKNRNKTVIKKEKGKTLNKYIYN